MLVEFPIPGKSLSLSLSSRMCNYSGRSGEVCQTSQQGHHSLVYEK